MSSMISTAFTAALLRASQEGFAGLAASRLVARSPAASSMDSIEGWRTYERNLLAGLAAALEDDAPAGFAARNAWSRDAFVARGVSTETLKDALACLREVLEESLPTDAWSMLPPYFERARGELSLVAAPLDDGIDTNDPRGQIAADHLAAMLAYDEPRALAVVLEAIGNGCLSVRDALEAVIVPAQRELGRMWHRGQISIADEHFATGVTRRLIERILARAPRVERIIVGGSAFAAQEKTWKRAGADAFANSPREAIEVASRLLAS